MEFSAFKDPEKDPGLQYRLGVQTVGGGYSTKTGNPFVPVSQSYPSFNGYMSSKGNPMPPEAHRDSGGRWWQSYTSSVRSTQSVNVKGGGLSSARYIGTTCLGDTRIYTTLPPTPPTLINWSVADLNAFGATAIARTEPTDAYFSGATALGELLIDRVPEIPLSNTLKRDISTARKAGGNYLNVEFGWKPLVSDVQKLASAIQKSDDIMDAYRRDSGKNVKASYDAPTETYEYRDPFVRVNVLSGSPLLGPVYCVREYKRTQKVWFNGCFRYYCPTPDSGPAGRLQNLAQRARKVYGIIPDPETLWNIGPWTWAADWFGNTGDIIHNMVAIGRDGLVLRYGYVMCETKTEEYVYTIPGSQGASIYGHLEMRNTAISRVRLKATPYGFGISSGDLNNSQIAILAALGLSMF